jgi:antitoxin YefM
MLSETTYTQARDNLASFLDHVVLNREIVIIKRRGHDDVALIAADELSSLLESVHLLRSPNNAKRLFDAIDEADAGKGKVMTVEELRQEFNLHE